MSKVYKYKKIDAFTAGKSLGNPAACLYLSLGQELTEEEMLEVAKQHKGYVSEMVYCKKDPDTIHLTYYSSECEVDFCGHGTIACTYSLIKDTPDLLAQKEIQIQTNRKGNLVVYNRILEQDAVLITAPVPNYLGTELTKEKIAETLDTTVDAIDGELPVDLVDAGLRTLIVPMRDLANEVSLFPDRKKLETFCIENGIDIILIFSSEVAKTDHIAHTRVFAPKFGYLEDPATGSGNSAFGYYMLKYQLWDGGDCCLEQGGNDRVFNDIYLSSIDGAVLFGGSATVRTDGVYYV
ncbi:PhzF family phenazine biosynthesis protein [Enterococcus sp. 669A]|uniref:PhzF family phenazine biosynthesis protein n=1 Tax=Candidatus Enterococcus moelleringii TaxID=2815325 RepID=A0ABS3L8S6_9ENTE|nr:PhzF family phenazine biosynthesis isomerase [Enterococcus sp. 669A]MBO1306028.1 PhzF family phenazine biosynthesis protein [Enterococcus sp. 669A]